MKPGFYRGLNMSWSNKDFRKWSENTITDIEIKDLQVIKKILSAPAKAMRAQSLQKVHDAVTLIAQYGMYIQNQLNSVRASYKYYKTKYRERLAQVLTAHKVEGKSRDEREIFAVQIDEALRDLHERMLEFKLKTERLDGIPYSITTYYNVLMEIYKLKVHERKYLND